MKHLNASANPGHEQSWLVKLRVLSYQTGFRRLLLVVLTVLASLAAFAQNAIVGAGFAPGWGGACGTNTDFQYFSTGAGSSWIRTSVANGTGNQYFRLGVDWSGQLRQHTLTPGSDVQVNAGTEYTLNNTCTTSGSMYINVANTSHNYVFKTADAGTTPSYRFIYFRVDGAIRSISTVSVPAAVYAGSPATITAILDGAVSPGQAVYLRYTTDAFATSTVVPMTGGTTTVTANIPAMTLGTEVKYYCFTSGPGLTISHANADFYAINLNGNGGLNYGYTVQAQPPFNTIANGNWSNAATWQGGNIPNSLTAVVNIKHNVNAIGNYSVKDITIDAGKTLSIFNVLTIADGGTVNNIGNLATNGRLKFAGAGTIVNKNPDHLFDVELNGPVQLSGCSIKNMLEIKANGSVAAGPALAFVGTLYINTGGPYNHGYEWPMAPAVSSVRIGPGTTYTLCDASASAAYSTYQDVTVENTGTFILDPLCGGNTGAPAGALQTTNMLTIGGNLNINNGAAFTVQRGDVGSLQAGSRFNLLVNGNLVNAGTLTLNDDIGDDLVLKGNWSNTGTFDPGKNSAAVGDPVRADDGRAVIFAGTQAQAINSGAGSFHFLAIDNTAGVTLNADATTSRGLTLTNGKLNLNGKTLVLGSVYKPGAGDHIFGVLTGGNASSYCYGGKLVRWVSNKTQTVTNEEQFAPNLNSAYLFAVGSATDYRPFSITYTAFATAFGGLEVSHTAGTGVVTGSLPNATDGDGTTVTRVYEDALWTAAEVQGLTGGSYTVAYTCNNCNVGVSNLPKIRAMKRADAAANWALPGTLVATTGTNVSPTVGRSGVSGFSQFGVGYDPVVLPVRLLYVNAIAQGNANLVSWATAGETGFRGFEVQRSTNGRDFAPLGEVKAQGGSGTTSRTYSYRDAGAQGTVYYRLKMNDLDGSYSYSKTVKVTTLQQGGPVVSLLPGPRLLLQGLANAESKVTISDNSGRILGSYRLSNAPVQTLDLPALAKGVYLVLIDGATGRSTHRVVW
jgi:hypothetical protein